MTFFILVRKNKYCLQKIELFPICDINVHKWGKKNQLSDFEWEKGYDLKIYDLPYKQINHPLLWNSYL